MERMTTKHAKHTKGGERSKALCLHFLGQFSCGSCISWCQFPCLEMTTKHAKYAKAEAGSRMAIRWSPVWMPYSRWFVYFVVPIPPSWNDHETR